MLLVQKTGLRLASMLDKLGRSSRIGYPLPISSGDGSRVPRVARALAASGVSAVDTHRSNWDSGCTG